MSRSIATQRGDAGQTALTGGVRVSKSSLQVETYGTIDELNSLMGFARSICDNEEIKNLLKEIQRELFQVGSALATPPKSRKGQPPDKGGPSDRGHQGNSYRLVDPRRASRLRRARHGPHRLPAGGALYGPTGRIGNGNQPARSGLFEPPFGFAVDSGAADRKARG